MIGPYAPNVFFILFILLYLFYAIYVLAITFINSIYNSTKIKYCHKCRKIYDYEKNHVDKNNEQ